ncbi:helix-turn-helix transcriptional regulator [Demequina silvatica]|uniref:helix-turn-helix transcriptional regulator n=1 Tax=Demequina silvatica TaxID=1638988 RepID=UPI000780AEB0|nr:helix-turn-helix domain-containing protein [Demequina silvatica]
MGRREISMTPAAAEAARLLGLQIRLARHDKRWSAAELADRAGVSQRTVLSIEAGKPTPSIGNVLNVAALAGVELFAMSDPLELALARRRAEDRLALLPALVRKLDDKDDDGDYDF